MRLLRIVGVVTVCISKAGRTSTQSLSLVDLTPADKTNDGKKCGKSDSPDRLFDLRSKDATEKNCKAKCNEKTDCVAFSAIFGQWCIGCRVPLSEAHKDAKAFSKDAIPRDKSKDGKKCGKVGSKDRVFDFRTSDANEEKCKAACLSNTNCTAFSGVFGKWCIGCKVPLGEEHSGKDGKPKAFKRDGNTEAASPMKHDKGKDGKKCGKKGSKDRVFDLRVKDATLEKCKAKCASTENCKAISTVVGEWCIGCKAPLNEPHKGAVAFKKEESTSTSKL